MTGNKKDMYQAECIVVMKGVSERRGYTTAESEWWWPEERT